MSRYQLTLVLTETAAKNEKKAQAFISSLIESVKGKVKTSQNNGLRDLAYPIKKAKRGGYFFLEIELEPGRTGDLNRLFRQNEAILRHLLITNKK